MITYLTTAHYEHNFLYVYMYGQMAEPTIIDGVIFSLSLSLSLSLSPPPTHTHMHTHTHAFSVDAKTTLYPNQYVRCSIKAALYLEVVVCVILW